MAVRRLFLSKNILLCSKIYSEQTPVGWIQLQKQKGQNQAIFLPPLHSSVKPKGRQNLWALVVCAHMIQDAKVTLSLVTGCLQGCVHRILTMIKSKFSSFLSISSSSPSFHCQKGTTRVRKKGRMGDKKRKTLQNRVQKGYLRVGTKMSIPVWFDKNLITSASVYFKAGKSFCWISMYVIDYLTV